MKLNRLCVYFLSLGFVGGGVFTWAVLSGIWHGGNAW